MSVNKPVNLALGTLALVDFPQNFYWRSTHDFSID